MAKKNTASTDDAHIEAVVEAEVFTPPDTPTVIATAVDGCVIDWGAGVQVNPQTGQRFDFDGHLID